MSAYVTDAQRDIYEPNSTSKVADGLYEWRLNGPSLIPAGIEEEGGRVQLLRHFLNYMRYMVLKKFLVTSPHTGILLRQKLRSRV